MLNNRLYNLDYDNTVTLTPNSAFTPNSNGYVIIIGKSTGTYGNIAILLGNSYASISSNPEKWLGVSQQNKEYLVSLNIPITKGQTYYFYAEAVSLFSARFVPFK